MVRVLLIVAACGATACSGAPPPGPVAPLAEAVPTVPDSLWDKGTYVQFENNALLEQVAENFEIYQTASGYRFVITWQRPTPTGEPGEGKVTLETDPRFSPISGEMVSTLHMPSRDEVIRSRIFRETDGRLATEIQAADGSKESASSKGPNDWYIGGTITSFLVALCGADASFTAPKVYPDKDTTLEPPQPLPIEGSPRTLTFRRLTYAGSGRIVVAACEDGKLAGEYTRGATIVRSGDLALARVLDARFR